MLLLALLVFPMAAQADVIGPGGPPRNRQSEAFVAVYGDKLTDWDSAYDHAFDGVEQIVLWSHPGSGEVTGVVGNWFENTAPAEALGPCYVDGEGRFWGYINYIYGHRLSWICLSDPENEALAADESVVRAVEKEAGGMAFREALPVALLVVGAAAATGVLIYVFWYRRKNRA